MIDDRDRFTLLSVAPLCSSPVLWLQVILCALYESSHSCMTSSTLTNPLVNTSPRATIFCARTFSARSTINSYPINSYPITSCSLARGRQPVRGRTRGCAGAHAATPNLLLHLSRGVKPPRDRPGAPCAAHAQTNAKRCPFH